MSDAPDKTSDVLLAPRSSPVLPIVLGLNTALLVAVLVKVFLFPAPVAAAEAQAGERPEAAPRGHGEHGLGPTVKLADFVVHLRNPEAERYARMSFELEVSGEEQKAALAGVMPKVREVFLSYLSDRTVEELRGSEGIERTKRELLVRLGQAVEGAPVRAIYITDIVIQ